jgi:hypothetical protein
MNTFPPLLQINLQLHDTWVSKTFNLKESVRIFDELGAAQRLIKALPQETQVRQAINISYNRHLFHPFIIIIVKLHIKPFSDISSRFVAPFLSFG